jgi:hypothetical protein
MTDPLFEYAIVNDRGAVFLRSAHLKSIGEIEHAQGFPQPTAATA